MIPLPSGVRVWLATGYTDMRKGFPSLALQVQEILHRDPLSGHLFCFRGRRGNLLKVLWHDGQGEMVCRQPYRLRIRQACDFPVGRNDANIHQFGGPGNPGFSQEEESSDV
jgi:transposase